MRALELCDNVTQIHVLTLAPAARPGVQVVWVEPVGSVHFG